MTCIVKFNLTLLKQVFVYIWVRKVKKLKFYTFSNH